jgi:hypothetical protein
MSWLIPALVAPFINAINGFVDKFLVSGAIKSPKVLPVYMAIISFLIGTGIWTFFGFFHPTVFALFGVASGVTTVIAVAAYFELMARKDVGEMIFYFGLTTPFIFYPFVCVSGRSDFTVADGGFCFDAVRGRTGFL